MSVNQPSDNLDALNQETRELWEQIAPVWDDFMGAEGNSFQTVLIGPATERLLGIQPGERVLDIACGNGSFSRRLAQLGAYVVACDFSANFIERAKLRTTENADRIEYRVIDATDYEQLMSLGEGQYDAAVCTMAIMDMAAIEPMLSALTRLLEPGGRFVFSVMHPCFNNMGTTKLVEEEDRAGEIVTTYSMKVRRYLHQPTVKGLGILTQPVPENYFHRPLHVLFDACFQAGFVMDGLEEPAFGPEHTSPNALSWLNFHETPPVLVTRWRMAG